MEQAEQLLREWCERHPGWRWQFRHFSDAEDPDLRHVEFQLYGAGDVFADVVTISEFMAGQCRTVDLVATLLCKRVGLLLRQAEQWIAFVSNEGGCTPTRR